MRGTLGVTLPIWPGLDTAPRLRRRLEESRRVNESLATKRVVREMLYGDQGKVGQKR